MPKTLDSAEKTIISLCDSGLRSLLSRYKAKPRRGKMLERLKLLEEIVQRLEVLQLGKVT